MLLGSEAFRFGADVREQRGAKAVSFGFGLAEPLAVAPVAALVLRRLGVSPLGCSVSGWLCSITTASFSRTFSGSLVCSVISLSRSFMGCRLVRRRFQRADV